MRAASFLLLLAACGGPTLDLPVPTADPGVAPPPVGSLPALQLSPWRSGQPIRARVTDAPVGANVYLLGNTAGPGAGPCHPSVQLCAGLTAPLDVLAVGQTDAAGMVDLSTMPSGTEAQWLQVAIIGAGGNVGYAMPVQVRVLDDADGDWVVDSVDNCPDDKNDSQFDDDGDGFGTACDCDDADATIFPGAVDAPGDFVDGDCDGVDEGTTPATFAGTYTGDVDLDLGGELLNLGTLGLTELPCLGTATIEVDLAATPQITGSGSCATSFAGISGPSYPFSFTGDMAFQPTGEFDFLGALGSWNGVFGTAGTAPVLTVNVDLDAYGLTLTGTIYASM